MQSKFSPKNCHFLKINSTTTTTTSSGVDTQHRDVWQHNLRYNRDLSRRINRQANSKISESLEKYEAS